LEELSDCSGEVPEENEESVETSSYKPNNYAEVYHEANLLKYGKKSKPKPQ
jgi:hypothetical protein